MMTTITFFIWFCGIGVGVGEGDEVLTPPQPQIKARRGTTMKDKKIRLKYTSHPQILLS
jgi:hypothetical protein